MIDYYENEISQAIIQRVRTILSSFERWTDGPSASNSKGEPCFPDSPEAVKWCISGAFQRAMWHLETTPDETHEARDLVEESIKDLFPTMDTYLIEINERGPDIHSTLQRWPAEKRYDTIVQLLDMTLAKFSVS